jgi:FSR family fosmidomycin resistance protein-like MFS transporter
MSIVSTFRQLSKVAYLVALAHLALEFTQNFMPVIYPLIIASMGLTYSQVGTLAFTASLASSVMQPLFGYLSDKWNPRLIAVSSVASSSIVMGTIGFVGFYSDQYLLLLPIIAFGGLASAAFHPAGASLATAGISRRKGTALSVFSVGGNLGSALSPLAVGMGLAWVGIRGTAILIPIGLTLSMVLLRGLRHVPLQTGVQAPVSGISTGSSPSKAGSWLAIGLIVVIVAARSWFQGALITYMPEWLQSQGRSLELSGSILSTLLVASSLGSLLGGTLSDRVGALTVVLVSLLALGPAHWLFLHSGGLVQIVWVATIGVLIGSTFPVAIMLAQESMPGTVGLASSLVLGLGWLPAGIGSWFIGTVADRTSLTGALSSLVLVPSIGVASGLMLAWHRSRS